MSDPAQSHNDEIGRLVAEMWRLAERTPSRLNVLAESLLVGVGMFNFPDDPRKQAQIIQAIADGAQDRAEAVGRRKIP